MTELPLPIPLLAAKIALVAAFLLHIVFVNLMVGGTLLSLHAHRRGLTDPVMYALAHRLVSTVTVHKSIAVVLGVGPLLLVSIAYTTPFYTSSALIAPAWLSVLPLVTTAFCLLYAYKYGFDHWHRTHPRLHAASGLGAMACLLFIPLIYLTNTQLMLDAAAMARRPGFFEAMFTVGNVFPRYLHFMLASVALTGFWVAMWWDRPASPFAPDERVAVVRFGTGWALVATSLQFLAGPLVLVTLPRGGLTGWVALTLAVGVLCGLAAIFLMADTLRGTNKLKPAALLILVTVVCMGTSRHLIRESLLKRTTVGWSPLLPVARIAMESETEEGSHHGDARYEAAGRVPVDRGGRVPGA